MQCRGVEEEEAERAERGVFGYSLSEREAHPGPKIALFAVTRAWRYQRPVQHLRQESERIAQLARPPQKGFFVEEILVTSIVGFLPRTQKSAKDLRVLSQILINLGSLSVDTSRLIRLEKRGAADLRLSHGWEIDGAEIFFVPGGKASQQRSDGVAFSC